MGDLKGRGRAVAVIASCALAAVGVIAVVRTCAPRASGADLRADRPALAAVLVPGVRRCEVVIVDLERRAVDRRVPLRSLATDMAFDPRTGRLITAQAGGIGQDSDDVLGDVDPRSGDVRYLRLPHPNPGSVACAGGVAYALHGLEIDGRMVASVVDIDKGSVRSSARVPPTSGLWQAAFGDIWTLAVPTEGTATAIVRLGASRLETVAAYPCAGMVDSLVAGPTSLYALYGARSGPSGESTTGSIARIDPAAGTPIRTRVVPEMGHGLTRGAIAAGRIAAIGWSGEPSQDDRVVVLDADTLADAGTVRIGGVPCALAPYGDLVVAVDGSGGRLVIIDPVRARVVAAIDLGTSDLLFSDVEVVPRSVGDGR